MREGEKGEAISAIKEVKEWRQIQRVGGASTPIVPSEGLLGQ